MTNYTDIALGIVIGVIFFLIIAFVLVYLLSLSIPGYIEGLLTNFLIDSQEFFGQGAGKQVYACFLRFTGTL